MLDLEMTFRSTAFEWRSVLRRLRIGNRRYAAGAPLAGADGDDRPIAVVACSERWPIPPDRLFDVSPEELYVVQVDLGDVSQDLLAGLELAAAQGVRVAVILGASDLREKLEVLLAPRGMAVFEGVVGPNGRVRFSGPDEIDIA